MTAKRKPMRARSAAPEQKPASTEPTERQIGDGMLAFEAARRRYRVENRGRTFIGICREDAHGDFPTNEKFLLFRDENSAKYWRLHEIMREAITAGMRAKP